MERVALSLQKSAISFQGEKDDFDQFGRSAFNRYYYSVFLIVRSLILEFNPTWSATHSSIPEMLTGSIDGEIRKFRSKIQKQGDAESVLLLNQAIAALSDLSKLMKDANASRVVADYNPHIKIVLAKEDRFTLGPISINQAHNWPQEARTLARVIQRGWRLARGGA